MPYLKYDPNYKYDANSHRLKVDQKFFGWAWPEMGLVSMTMGL